MGTNGHHSVEEDAGLDYVSVGRRLMSGLVDWVVAFVVGFIGVPFVQVVWAFFELGSFERNLVSGITVWTIPAFLLIVMVTHVVYGFRISTSGKTLGHRLMDVRVVKPDGARIGLGPSLARQFSGSPLLVAYVFPMFVLIVVWIYVVQRANEYMALTWISGTSYFRRSSLAGIGTRVFFAVDRSKPCFDGNRCSGSRMARQDRWSFGGEGQVVNVAGLLVFMVDSGGVSSQD